MSLVAQARVLSGNKLEQLVMRLQRHSGRPKQECWRFVIQHGLKTTVDHRRWTEEEIEFVREALVKLTIEEIAKKLHRTPQAIRSMLVRNHLGIREIRCDRFSVESLALALRVQTEEIRLWIDQGWLQATISMQGKRRSYIITPEALTLLYKEHLPKILHRGLRNQALFDAYFQYCYSPKHTLGEQLLDVRRDKRERAAFLALGQADTGREAGEEDDDRDEREYHLDVNENIGEMIGNDTE
jgi:hypothetical protein